MLEIVIDNEFDRFINLEKSNTYLEKNVSKISIDLKKDKKAYISRKQKSQYAVISWLLVFLFPSI